MGDRVDDEGVIKFRLLPYRRPESNEKDKKLECEYAKLSAITTRLWVGNVYLSDARVAIRTQTETAHLYNNQTVLAAHDSIKLVFTWFRS